MTKEEVKEAVIAALQEKLGDFFIEREKHYHHHEFLENVMCTRDKIKNVAIKTTTAGLIGLAITILYMGFKDYLKSLIGK